MAGSRQQSPGPLFGRLPQGVIMALASPVAGSLSQQPWK